MNQNVEYYIAIAIEVARRFMEVVTEDPKVGRFISSHPISSSISSTSEGKLKNLVYKTWFHFPKHGKNILVKVTLQTIVDGQTEPYIKMIEVMSIPREEILAKISFGNAHKRETIDDVDFSRKQLTGSVWDAFEDLRIRF